MPLGAATLIRHLSPPPWQQSPSVALQSSPSRLGQLLRMCSSSARQVAGTSSLGLPSSSRFTIGLTSAQRAVCPSPSGSLTRRILPFTEGMVRHSIVSVLCRCGWQQPTSCYWSIFLRLEWGAARAQVCGSTLRVAWIGAVIGSNFGAAIAAIQSSQSQGNVSRGFGAAQLAQHSEPMSSTRAWTSSTGT